jgi:CheY-like chemotaxis protein
MRVYVVEDETLVLLDLSLALEDRGHVVVGTASELSRAVDLARELSFDCAVLDINIAGHNSWPVADVLAERGIPFVFVSGYTRTIVPDAHRLRPLLTKPCLPDELDAVIQMVVAGSGKSRKQSSL